MALMPNPLAAVQQGQNWIDGLFAQRANREAGAALAQGNYGAAANTQFRAGNLAGGAAIQDRQVADQTRQRTQQDAQRAQQLQTTLQASRALRQTRDSGGDVIAEFDALVPTFTAMGTDPGELQQIRATIAANPAFLDQVEQIVGQQLRELSFQKAGDQLLVFEQGNPDPVRQFNAPRQPINVGGVLVNPETYEPLLDTRRPELIKTEDGGAPVILGIGPDGQTTEAWRGEAAGPQVRNLSPAEVESMGLQPGVYQTDQTGRITPVSGQGGDRLSAGQQKQVETYYQDVQGLETINSELGRFDRMISSGQLNLNPVSNTLGGVRNALNMSDNNSRNLAEFRSTLERVRNDSLRLNNGVQTEGDAQRAWNELLDNLNDEEVVRRQLRRVQDINNRALRFRQQRIATLEGGSRQPQGQAQGQQTQTRQRPAPGSFPLPNGTPQQVQAWQSLGLGQGPVGSATNPRPLNPNSPAASYNNAPSGSYFFNARGEVVGPKP